MLLPGDRRLKIHIQHSFILRMEITEVRFEYRLLPRYV
jgi:hypothetical protein